MSTVLAGKTFKAFAILIFVGLAAMAARSGAADLFIASAEESTSLGSANRALMLASGNAEAHLVRGELWEMQTDLPRAINDYETAVAARPADYALWLTLARARELNGENQAAISEARVAVTLAPFYAQPHWQLGNFLVRGGEVDEGFKELRIAAISNSSLLPTIIDLAGQLSNGDAEFIKRVINPQNAASYKALADYFKRRSQTSEAIAMFRAAGNDPEVKADREQYVADLIAGKNFKEAYGLWAVSRPSVAGIGVINDPGFEQESNLDEPGFGWHTDNKSASLMRSLDGESPREGQSSLKIDFNGESDPAAPIISQLVLIEPNTNYELHFSVRSQDLVSGGLPGVFVSDAHRNSVIGQMSPLPRSTNGWIDSSITFVSGEADAVIQVSLQRVHCEAKCPVFGHLWLDNFSLQKPLRQKR